MTIVASLVVFAYLISSGLFLGVMAGDRKKLSVPGLVALVVGLVFHVVAIAMVVHQQGAGALLQIQYGLSLLSLMLGVGFLVLRQIYAFDSFASFVVPLMMLLQGVAVVAEPDMVVAPEWKGPLLALHIGSALLGTAAFVLAALTSVFYLIQDHNLRKKKFGPLFNRLPSVDALDRAHVRLVSVGFPIYTIAIALGGFWAWDHSASGIQMQYLFAIVSWLIYAGIIHARLTVGWRGRRAAVLTLVGLVGLGAVLSTYMARATLT